VPRIASLSPTRGSDRGGTAVTVHGRSLAGGTVYVDGSPVQSRDCNAGRGTADLCFVTPPHAPTLALVTVRVAGGPQSNAIPFGYTKTPPPVIRALTPDGGSDNGGTQVVVTGDSLDQGSVFVGAVGVPTEECAQRSSPVIALCFTTPPHAHGAAVVTVHTPDGAVSNSARFLYRSTPAPRIAHLTPQNGPDIGGTRVEVSGTNLDQGAVLIDGHRVETQPCGPRSSTTQHPSDLCFVTPGHPAGHVVVTVVTPNGRSSNGIRYTYNDTPAPQIRRLSPTHGPDNGGDRVRVEGTHLDRGVVLVDGTPMPTESCPIPRTQRLGLCFITPPHRAGHASITVATPNGKTSNPVPYIYDNTPAPAITSVRPSIVSTAGDTQVTIVGDHVAQGTAYVNGQPVTSGACTLNAGAFPGAHEALCFFAPAHAAGHVTLVVHTPNGKTSNVVGLTYEVTRRVR
jgi:hypothetical protein